MEIRRVLITGSNSYVGINVEKWLMKEPDKFYVETISVRGDAWKSFNFSKFDVVFHVSGIAHAKETKKNKDLYFKINKDLAIEVAELAKRSGVKQFVFMSSLSIYGLNGGLKKPEIINKNTVPYPKNYYGLSKLLAENAITKLSSLNFAVSIFRSPIIYGNKAKGNFNKLLKFILNYRFFPDINNQRSMLYVDNLCIFFREVIDKQLSGVFFPQNSDYINSTQIAKIASNITNKKILITKIFNPIIKNLNFSLFNKLFGTLIIDKSLNIQVNLNNQISLYQSLLQTLDYKNE